MTRRTNLIAAAACLATLLAAAACTDPVSRTTQNFDRPTDLALACYRLASDPNADPVPLPLWVCNESRHVLLGLVTNTEIGDVALLDISNRRNFDTSQAVPGFTRVTVGAMPAVAVTHPSGKFAYTINRGSSDISRLPTLPEAASSQTAVVTQPLPYRPFDAVIGPAPGTTPVEWDEPVPVQAANEHKDAFGERVSGWEDGAADAVAATEWALYVSAPDAGEILVLPLGAQPDDEEDDAPSGDDQPTDRFGALTGADVQTIPLPGGAPSRLALSSDGKTLFATHLDRGFVSVVDTATGAELQRLHLGHACANGVDDDGDGLVDADDPGCLDPNDDDETDPEWVDGVPACMNGADDDGDGLVDLDDPGCARAADATEDSDQLTCGGGDMPAGCTFVADPETEDLEDLTPTTACSNGLDDDGDGLVDLDDDDCPTAYSEGERQPACGNGIDDDGDGLVDLLDPGCCSRRGASETDPAPRDLVALAVGPGDTRLYVADASNFELHVIEWDAASLTATPIDVLAGDIEFAGHPLRRRLGKRGIPLPAAPRDLTILELDEGGVTAFVTDVSGGTSVIELTHPGFHCPLVSRKNDETGQDEVVGGEELFPPRETLYMRSRLERYDGASSLSQPTLLRGSEEVDLAFTLLPSYLSMGPFRVTDVSTQEELEAFYGSDYAAPKTLQCEHSDTSVVEPYQPDREDEQHIWYGVELASPLRQQLNETWTVTWQGLIPNSAGRGFLTDDGRLHDPDADFCALGVEPGDYLVIRTQDEETYDCESDGARFEGREFDWVVTEVTADTLTLSAGGQAWLPPEVTPGSLATQAELVMTAEGLPLPPADCFPGALDYAIRVGDHYAVVGNASGFLHNWENQGGVCVERADADPRFDGRANEARRDPNDPLRNCPPEEDDYDKKFEGEYFENFAFRVRLYPGCEIRDDAGIISLDGATERGVAWRFTVTSGYASSQLPTGRLPGSIKSISRPGWQEAWVVDSSGEAIYELDAELDDESVNYTFY